MARSPSAARQLASRQPWQPPRLSSEDRRVASTGSSPARSQSAGRSSRPDMQEEATGHSDGPRPTQLFDGPRIEVPALHIPTPRTRKIVSARYQSVGPKYMQPSWRTLVNDSSRSSANPSHRTVQQHTGRSASGAGASVAANVAAGRNHRLKHRYQPTVEEISRALRDRPYLTAHIVAVRDDPTLDKATRLMQIGKIVHECEVPAPQSDLERRQGTAASPPRPAPPPVPPLVTHTREVAHTFGRVTRTQLP